MKNILTIIGCLLFGASIFYVCYAPTSPAVPSLINSGMDFEYVTEEGSCFTSAGNAIGPSSQKYTLSLKSKPTNLVCSNQDKIFLKVGYNLKEIKFKKLTNL